MADNRIYSLDWIKGVMILCIVLFHSYFFPTFRGYLAVDVFFFISGYFMMSSFLRKPTTAVLYTWGRIKRLAAPYFISLILVCILCNRFFAAIDSFGSFIDISAKVFSAIPFAEELGGEITRTPFLLGCWFLSVLIIGSFLLYAMLQYNEHLATLVLFPAIVLLGYNTMFESSASLNIFTTRIGVLGAPLVRGLCDMSAGALICHVYFHYKSAIERRSTLINSLGLIAFVLFLATMFTIEDLDKYFIITIPWFLLASVLDNSWLNHFLKKIKGGMFARLGRYTIYIYCIHGIAQTLLFWFNDHFLNHALDGIVLLAAYLAAVAIATVVLYYISNMAVNLFTRHENQPDYTRL